MNLGPAEILVILVVALIVFGPKRLPEVGHQVGKAVRELRKMQDTVKGELEHVMHHDVLGGNPSSSETSSTVESPGIEEGDHSMPNSSGPNVSGNGSNSNGSANGSAPHVTESGDTDDGFAAPGTFS